MIRESIVEFLDENGYAAVGASDGRDALDKLGASSDGPPCLILLDLMMPGMDGRAFRDHQLQSPELAAIPVIVFSAYRNVAAAGSEMKAAAPLEKPVRPPELLRAVRQYCTNVGERSRFS